MGEAVFDPARHRPLRAEPWSAARVEAEITSIAEDFAAAVGDDGSWPTHPFDSLTGAPRFDAYAGAAGAVCALRILRREGWPVADRSALLPRIHAGFLAQRELPHELGLQVGEIGILAPAVLAAPGDAARVERLDRCLREIRGHPAREITSGETGAMHAALSLYRETGDDRWRAHYVALAESLFAAWRRHESGAWLFRSEIFGSVRHYYGACHGVAGNAHALWRGRDLLPREWREPILGRSTDALARGAIRDGPDLSWPVSVDASGTRRLMQWCHGAPGVVVAMAGLPDPALDALLAPAAETVWRAGPLAKGAGLCHGTAGNGYALLAMHARSGDARWLERARVFAIHAIGQSLRARERHGRRRYTLWTGDGGLAVYLLHCLRPERAAFPGLELF